MKKHFFGLLLAFSALSVSSCEKDPKLPTPGVEEFPQIYTNITAQSSYKVSEIQSNPTATINLDVRGGNVNDVEAIEIYRQARTFNVPTGTTPAPVVAAGGPRVLLKTVPPVSGDVQIPLSEMIAGLTRPTGAAQTGPRAAITSASLRATEGFLITYGLLLKNSRRIEYNASFNNTPFSGIVTIVP
jgi:hypothetical protein